MHGWFWGYGTAPRVLYGWSGMAMSWWGRGFMIGMFLLGVALVIILARYLSKRSQGDSRSSEALQILKKRYASGEIDRQAFDQMRRDIL